jgi:Domain of unknown function (DUF222)
MTKRVPQVGELLREGRIDVRRARVLVDGTAHLAVHTARRVVAGVADQAAELTTGQLRASIRKLCLTIDPDDDATRTEQAIEERRVVSGDLPRHRQPVAARSTPRPGHRRPGPHRLARPSTPGRRPEHGSTPCRCRPRPAHRPWRCSGSRDGRSHRRPAHPARAREEPGDLGAFGPVVADIARRVVDRQTDCRWHATVIDDHGDPLTVAVRRRPRASQTRQVRARYRACIFPGCRRPAGSSDLDHTTRYADGGPTLERNLAPLCRFHHRAKDEAAWNYRRRTDGDHVWTSPLGHTYLTSGRSP